MKKQKKQSKCKCKQKPTRHGKTNAGANRCKFFNKTQSQDEEQQGFFVLASDPPTTRVVPSLMLAGAD